jgi:hypothetical protein
MHTVTHISHANLSKLEKRDSLQGKMH